MSQFLDKFKTKLGKKSSSTIPKEANSARTIPSSNDATRATQRQNRPQDELLGPPPAYTPVAPLPASTAQQALVNPAISSAPDSSAVDDQYDFLRTFDTVFLIDDSGSMAGRSWRETSAALETITPICVKYDKDGVDIHFLNAKDSPWFQHVTSAATVREIFSTVRPYGGTPTGQRLNQILKPYLQRYSSKPETTKPLNIIVITDGKPSDDVESTIIAAAKKLDKLDAPPWQVGIQFFQVGREPQARQHLKQLDDGLAELAGDDELRDMVDTVPFLGDDDSELTGDGIIKVVLGACNRRLDRTSKDLHKR